MFRHVVVILLLVSPCCVLSSRGSQDLPPQLLKSMTAARGREVNICDKLAPFTLRRTSEYPDGITPRGRGAPPSGNESVEYAMRDGMVFKKEYVGGTLQIMAVNDRYAFAISQKPNQKGYTLNYLDKKTAGRANRERDKEMKRLGVFFTRAWRRSGEYFADQLKMPDTRILSVKEFDENGKKLVRVDYEQHLLDERRDALVRDAYIVCDPELDWAIVECSRVLHVNRKDGSVANVRDKYTEQYELIKNIPVATRASVIIGGADLTKSRELQAELQSLNVLTTYEMSFTPDRAQFYLSHYGLKEPTFRSWFWGWNAVYAVLSLATLIVAIRLRQRIIASTYATRS